MDEHTPKMGPRSDTGGGGDGDHSGEGNNGGLRISDERRELSNITLSWAAFSQAIRSFGDRVESVVEAMRATSQAFDLLAGSPHLKRSELERIDELLLESEAAAVETRQAVARLLAQLG